MTKTTPGLLALSASLRAARTSDGISLRRLAHKLGVSAQALSLWETGKRSPAIEDVAHLLGFLRLSPPDYHRIMWLRHQLDNQISVETVDAGPAGYLRTIEELAVRTFEWAPQVVPEPLQTPEYIQAMMQGQANSPDELDQAVFDHQVRQLERRRSGRHTVLLGHAALEPAVVPQLQAIRALTEQPTLNVGIVRPSHPAAGTIEPFIIYEVTRDVFTVALRHQDNVFLVSEPDTVQRYRSTFRALERESIAPRDYRPSTTP